MTALFKERANGGHEFLVVINMFQYVKKSNEVKMPLRMSASVRNNIGHLQIFKAKRTLASLYGIAVEVYACRLPALFFGVGKKIPHPTANIEHTAAFWRKKSYGLFIIPLRL